MKNILAFAILSLIFLGCSSDGESIDARPYYFPFKEEPTIYMYSTTTKTVDGGVFYGDEYVEFGMLKKDKFYMKSMYEDFSIKDSSILVSNSKGVSISEYYTFRPDRDRIKSKILKDEAYPWQRSLGDNNTFEISTVTAFSGMVFEQIVKTDITLKGIETVHNKFSNSSKCLVLKSKLKITGFNKMNPNAKEEIFTEATIYDLENIGLYRIVSKSSDGQTHEKILTKIITAN